MKTFFVFFSAGLGFLYHFLELVQTCLVAVLSCVELLVEDLTVDSIPYKEQLVLLVDAPIGFHLVFDELLGECIGILVCQYPVIPHEVLHRRLILAGQGDTKRCVQSVHDILRVLCQGGMVDSEASCNGQQNSH